MWEQRTIAPLMQRAIALGSTVYTDEYQIYDRLSAWGDEHQSVNHSAGEYARDDDGDGLCEVHVNTMEGFSLIAAFMVRTASWHFAGEPALVAGLL